MPSKTQTEQNQLPPDQMVKEMGLRFSCDADSGIRRLGAGKGFTYKTARGDRVTDKSTLARIRSLAIPPAWTDVWICQTSHGHLQATGRDSRGRKQYRYHPDWREHRDGAKFDRLAEFGAALPTIRAKVESDLHRHGIPREKVLAAIVALLEQTAIRIGNDEYARSNRSYGLTTLQDRHVQTTTNSVRFRFTGKSGKTHAITLHDRRLATVVARCQDLPGQRLFVYESDDGVPVAISSSDVNDYLRATTGQDFTARTFRTWIGTAVAVSVLRHLPAPDTKAEANREIVAAVDAVAEHLGNTRSVARGSYVHPVVFQAWQAGTLQKIDPESAPDPEPGGLSPDERVTLKLVRA